jgi:hypothetical protein
VASDSRRVGVALRACWQSVADDQSGIRIASEEMPFF